MEAMMCFLNIPNTVRIHVCTPAMNSAWTPGLSCWPTPVLPLKPSSASPTLGAPAHLAASVSTVLFLKAVVFLSV